MKTVAPLVSHPQRAQRGLAMVELLCASTLAVMVLAGALITFSALQRSFVASLYQMNAQNDQNRVFSYLRRDLRGASTVQIGAQGSQITLNVPAPTTSVMNLNLGGALLSLLDLPQNSPTSSTIRYYRQGTSIIREVNGEVTELSTSATKFLTNLQGATVRIDAGFQPRFCIGLKSAVVPATEATAYVHLLNSPQL